MHDDLGQYLNELQIDLGYVKQGKAVMDNRETRSKIGKMSQKNYLVGSCDLQIYYNHVDNIKSLYKTNVA